MINEIDMEKQFSKLKGDVKLEDLKPDSKIGMLIDKMMARTREINKQKEEVVNMVKLTGP